MNSSTRLYERLDQIPQDPDDPESLEDLVVCAFGAFERYYVCWKNRGGEYKQGECAYGYDLPPSLKEWLFPTDGTTRDFPSLQVVFGRGDDYFASDKNGKLEKKEPEIKKPPPSAEGDELTERPPMRRSRTISFLRPLSDPTARIGSSSGDVAERRDSAQSTFSKRSSSISSLSQSSLWTPNTPSSRPLSDPAIKSVEPIDARIATIVDESPKDFPTPTSTPTPTPTPLPPLIPTRPVRRPIPLSMSFNPSSFPKIVEGKPLVSRNTSPVKDPTHCTCGFHPATPPPPAVMKRSTYTDSSMQTDPMPPTPPPRTPLRINTTTTTTDNDACSLFYSNTSSALEVHTPLTDDLPAPNPVYMGRMMDYFSKPGYQLGDSLFSSYGNYQQPVYYQEEEEYAEEEWAPDENRRQTV
ncbi:hypothetical protein K504DRAFT_416682 [Pleomassaria siparia CBS 279.74]|uniref:Uncharacterized protein n=1 Tax=Pleomassaria siparia CBS 279.74 TaxID=1314801 RepID=A0A6G1JVH9_9PLEO|nr:hypothetical protein K504DRAFT_416682 [Pleomassaria siparia CBS 279.74]